MGFVDLFLELEKTSLDWVLKKSKEQGITSVGLIASQGKDESSDVKVYSIPSMIGEDGTMKEIRGVYESSKTNLIHGGRRLGGDCKILRTVMSYCSDLKCRLVITPDDRPMSLDAQVSEGKASSISGMKGFPSVAESIGAFRALELSRESGVSVHLHGMSTARGLDVLRGFKAEGLDVTCSVSAANLRFTEEDLISSFWDPSFKMTIPLRSKRDQAALWEGIKDGTIDAITSDYVGISEEDRMVPFEEAPFCGVEFDGWIDRLFEEWEKNWSHVPKERLVHCLSSGPSEILSGR